jgi:hypothetical protein
MQVTIASYLLTFYDIKIIIGNLHLRAPVYYFKFEAGYKNVFTFSYYLAKTFML